jgi:hypothetical protein
MRQNEKSGVPLEKTANPTATNLGSMVVSRGDGIQLDADIGCGRPVFVSHTLAYESATESYKHVLLVFDPK